MKISEEQTLMLKNMMQIIEDDCPSEYNMMNTCSKLEQECILCWNRALQMKLNQNNREYF